MYFVKKSQIIKQTPKALIKGGIRLFGQDLFPLITISVVDIWKILLYSIYWWLTSVWKMMHNTLLLISAMCHISFKKTTQKTKNVTTSFWYDFRSSEQFSVTLVSIINRNSPSCLFICLDRINIKSDVFTVGTVLQLR